ncbi:MAG: helix-turn-helix domain-containing protein [Mycobacterium sp.]|nr:helix-turn-helix domain-containing protein [Mycobacterium sp.]
MNNPAEYDSSESAGRAGLSVPSLGRYLWAERVARGLSRAKAIKGAPMSAAYLNAIETEIRVPGPEIVQLLADIYEFDEAQRTYVKALHAPPLDFDPTSTRSAFDDNPALRHRLQDLDDVGLIAAYFDVAWNVLGANNCFRRTFPGLADAPVGAQWFFEPTAREVLTDWEHEAALLVKLLKTDLARYRSCMATWRLLRHLERDDDFYRLWTGDTRIATGRRADDHMSVRDLGTGTISSIGIQTGRLDSDITVRHFLGIRKPSAAAESS